MGLFRKKPLVELLEQRQDGTLANQVSTLFYPDPTWAFEKDTGLPMMFRLSARLGDIPYSVRWLGKKEKNVKPIGSAYYNENVNVYTYLDILRKRGSSRDALVPFFVELYGMKENLIDRCGTLEQLFADASYNAAMEKLAAAEKFHHGGAAIIRKALLAVRNKAELFPYQDVEDSTNRDMISRKLEFCEQQKQFLTALHEEAKSSYEKSKGQEKFGNSDLFDLMTEVKTAITWLAMHKVPWALRIYCDGRLLEESTGKIITHFPIGYYYSNIDTEYHRDFERREKAYAYSIEKGLILLKEAENEYAKLRNQYRSAKGDKAADVPDVILAKGKALYEAAHYQAAFDTLRPLAEANHKEALRLCASMLLKNQVRPVDWELTFRLLESEYDRGNTGVSELICSLYQKKGSITNTFFWGERGIKDGFPDCAFTMAKLYPEGSEDYKKYISKGAVAGSPICAFFAAWGYYDRRKGFLGYHTSARTYAQRALNGGIAEAAELLKIINEDEFHWESVNAAAKLAEMNRFREQEERDRQERALYLQKELEFRLSLNDPYTARDSTGRVLTVIPKTATATDGTNTYGVSEDNLKKMRVQRILNRKD